MGRSRGRLLFVVFSVSLSWPSLSSAQDQPAPQDNSARPLGAKELKKRDKRLLKELGSQGGDWLRDEVPEVITEAERLAFLRLSTNEEREQFIEIFWQKRNPEPDSPNNTAREEHYRRLAYADEHFASGVAGRNTDRGRIYIIWGPPDEIESHPTGGTYDRPSEQGGGSTTTSPWEMWRYRHLEGIGENIEIEFVDTSGSGEYHITRDPCEKDALAHVPVAGSSLSELLGRSSRAGRFTNTNGTTCPMPLGGTPASMDEFANLDRYFRVQRPPERFKDLAELVTIRVVRNQIHMDYQTDFLRVTSNTVLVPITVQVPNRDLRFQSKQGVHSAVLNLYGRITTPGGIVVQTFEDVIARDFPESLFQSSLNLSSIYQKSIPLRSGLYRLDLVVKDTLSGNLGVFNTALRVPRFEDDKLDASSLILADQIQTVPSSQTGTGQFVLDSYKVRPRLSQEFSSTEKLGVFLQLYNLKRDETSHKTNVSVAYRITKDQQEIWRAVETADRLHQGSEQLTIERLIPVASLLPGRYAIEVTAIDLLTNYTVIRTADFTVKPAPPSKPAATVRPPNS
ncbi:MAG: GWxTD domain-containing protein [Acidobacteria bacterium]|nr:MAG: GWxTD domain-containing protein [Acidobacteriota bacterium]